MSSELFLILGLGWAITPLIIGFVVGPIVELKHFRSIELREKKSISLPVVTFEDENYGSVDRAHLVTGSAVISLDYCKLFLGLLRMIVGGNIASYESLLDRARREATLRLKEKAPSADVIYNLRIEISSIGQSEATGNIEALAYGTAVWLKK